MLPLKIQETFAALRHPNYRVWFIGLLISMVGSWMQSTALGYLVYELTNSPAYLGYVGFASGVPILMFSIYAGVVADRVPRRNLILITQIAMMILAFILAGLVFSSLVQPWHIILLSFLLGICNAFDGPARHAFVSELVEREDLTNAIALNSTLFNSALVVGPAVAGFTYAFVGAAWCFTLNGISFIGVIIALLMIKLKVFQIPEKRKSAISEIMEGFRYIRSKEIIIILLSGLVIVSILGGGMVTLIPAWAVNILGGDVTTNGFLYSFRGIGALVGALMIASTGKQPIRGKFWSAGSFILPSAMFAFSFIRWMPLSFVLMIVVGWAFMIQINSINAMIQTRIDDQIRGRVMGVYSLMIMGGMPIGSLLIGSAASIIGEPMTVMLSAVLLMIYAGLIWFLRPDIRSLG